MRQASQSHCVESTRRSLTNEAKLQIRLLWLFPMVSVCDVPTKEISRTAKLTQTENAGGWSVEGIDSSVFSKSLCHHLSKAYAQSEVPRSVSLMRLLDRAFNSVQQDLVVEAGSATACLVRLDGKTDKLDALK